MTQPSTALERALVEQPEVSAFWIDSTRCRVFGRTGNRYTVRVRADGTFGCDCKAAEFSLACWHIEAAKLRPRPVGAEVAPPAAVMEAVTEAVEHYAGGNRYIKNLQAQIRHNPLSPGQVTTAAEVLAKDAELDTLETVDLSLVAERIELAEAGALAAPVQPKLPNGYYAVPLIQEGVQLFHVTWHWDAAQAAMGSQVVAFLAGNDAIRDFIPFAFLRTDKLSVWKRLASTVPNAVYQAFAILIGSQRPVDFMRRFATETHSCAICGKFLDESFFPGPVWHLECAPGRQPPL